MLAVLAEAERLLFGSEADAPRAAEEDPPQGPPEAAPEEEEGWDQELEDEAVALEAEIKKIEMDCAILDLRKDLELQEQLVASWGDGLRALREGIMPHEWTDEERREDKQMKAGLREAEEHVEEIRQRLERLETLRSDSP